MVSATSASEAPVVRSACIATCMRQRANDDASSLDAIRAGAVGYLLKDASAAELGAAVRQAAAGLSALAPSVATRLVQMTAVAPGVTAPSAAAVPAFASLTSRELEVLRLV